MASTGSQPPIVPPPNSHPMARRSSVFERNIKKDVSDVANELIATPARISVVVGTV
jgi:hypothetical protein